MSLQSILFNLRASRSDKKRDAAIPLPEGVTEFRDISYGRHGDHNLLDVYLPALIRGPLPTIVSIHGGGYVYGSKEIYRRYGMDMAKRGFAFVNFNYRLAPKWKFPTPLYDTNAVLHWICKNALRYHLDPTRIILLGDSAGAQLASQYAAMHTDRSYAAAFRMQMAPVTIRCLGLFCGMYDLAPMLSGSGKGLAQDYLGKDIPAEDPRLAVLNHITGSYPPAFVATACNDFLRPCAEPMYALLTKRGVPARFRCYGSPEQKEVGHVFHVNILLPEARACNDDAALFFAQYV